MDNGGCSIWSISHVTLKSVSHTLSCRDDAIFILGMLKLTEMLKLTRETDFKVDLSMDFPPAVDEFWPVEPRFLVTLRLLWGGWENTLSTPRGHLHEGEGVHTITCVSQYSSCFLILIA